MNLKDWTICLIEPNKFEAQIIVDLLRNAGVDRIKHYTDSTQAMETLELYNANIIIGSLDMQPLDGVAWTRAFRRNHQLANRKAAIFLTSRAFSRAIAEDCRHGGANALIGKPISGATLIATIKKVLGAPRPFIDAAGYVGPCRRAGIVTAGAPKKRRKADASATAAPVDGASLATAVLTLSNAVTEHILGRVRAETCETALKQVQAYAVNAGDGPLMRACAAFSLQLQAKGVRADAAKAALTVCLAGITQLAESAVTETAKREAIAENVRQAVAKAVTQRAA
ncbi:MAG: response regulator [Pseudomonadota bacterium]